MSEQKKSLPVLLIASLCHERRPAGPRRWHVGIATTRHDGPPRALRPAAWTAQRGGGMSGPFEERHRPHGRIESLGDQERREFRQNLSREWRETRGNRDAIDQARARSHGRRSSAR